MFQEKASKAKAKLQEQYTSVIDKFSNQIGHKDEIIDKTADALIEIVNKLKNTLHSK